MHVFHANVFAVLIVYLIIYFLAVASLNSFVMQRKKGWDSSVLSGYSILPEHKPVISGNTWQYAWPKIRSLPCYTGLDKPRTNPLPDVSENDEPQWSDETDGTALPDDQCVKEEQKGYKAKNTIAGLFVGCCIHQVCYGFHLMVEPEGRKDILKVLYERLPQEVLDNLTVVYDFSCQAAVYTTKREPELFARTKFLIDRYHCAFGI